MASENSIKTKKSAKTLQTAREAGYFGKKMLSEALLAGAEGRPIAWSMANWWEGDLIARTLGITMIFPENYGAFCAAVRQAEPYLEISDAEGFPNTLCGYARNCVGYAKNLADNNFAVPKGAPGGGMAKPTLMIASGAACDARYKWFQSLGRYLDNVPVWMLELPQTGMHEYFLPQNKAKNIKFIVHELREFVTFLENLTGKKLDYDELRIKVDQSLKTLRLAWEVDQLRKTVPSPMVSQDFWSIMLAHFYMPDDLEAYEFYQRVYDEVKSKVDNKIGAIPNEKYRIMFAELPPWHSIGFFDDIAAQFGIAAVMESWNYHAPTPLPEEEIDGITDPLELIARLTYHKFMEHNHTGLHFDTSPSYFYAAFLQWAQDYRADGFLAHPLMSCRPATYTLMHLRNSLEEILKVPGVVINGDIIDMRVFNPDEAMSKIEAFVETMDHYREIRQKEAMSW